MKILAYLSQECQDKVNDASLIAIMMKSIHSIFYSSYRKAGLVLAFLPPSLTSYSRKPSRIYHIFVDHFKFKSH